MRDQLVAVAIAAGILAVAVPGERLAGQAAAGTGTPKAASKAWTPPRTGDGQPDLQGVWNYATITPLERPLGLASKPVLTEEEATAQDEDARTRNDRAPAAGQTGVFNAFWWDLGRTLRDRRTSLIVDPADGRIPFTPEGQQRAHAPRGLDSWDDRSPWERCLTRNPAPLLPAGYNNNLQIVQAPGQVALLLEVVHDARIVPLDGRAHLGSNMRRWLGDSRGRWEGNTLVVDTTNFSVRNGFQGARDGLHLIERFTPVAPDTLNYEFTVDDPATYTRPWTAGLAMRRDPGGRVYEYACHEGNYGLAGILTGARAQERSATDAAAKGSN